MKKNRFVHLNVHSHYSIMDGCASIRELVDAAIKDKMLGIAITDNGNMSGVMEFFDYVSRINNERRQKGKKPFKAIIGCELYVAPGAKEDKKLGKHCNGHSLTVLAKNYQGYKNLIKIVSNSWTDGFYMRPRTDRADLEKYREGIIVLSSGIGSEVFTIFSDGDMSELDETIRWYRQTFAEDFYIELRRYADLFTSGSELQKITERLIEKADANGVKIVATNDVHYLRPTDIRVYNTLQSIAEGKTIEEYEKLNYPLNRWLRSRKEMCELFADIPAALDNTMEIFEKVEFYDIRHAPIVPSIDIPDGFGNERRTMEDNYLEYLSFSKANQIYGELLPENVSERLKFELQIIKQRGTSGYFLFLQDVVNTAQSELGVWVGPGRGSAAGSLVCYCLGITKIDPLKHDLLFERFLSPEGTMFPDIDIDFDDEGRKRVLEWLQQKYGKECCAHVVSFSTFSTANAFSTIAKAKQMLTPETMGVSELLSSHCGYYWHSIKDAIKYEPELRKLVRKAGASLRNAFDNTAVLERKIRGLGVHACGAVVADEPVSNWAPVSTCSIEDSKGNEKLVNCTQYDGWHVESSGLIKFDFLGLKTLSQMRDICVSVKVHNDKDFDIEKIPIDDEKTMELFQTGQTDDVFQFTSKGMQKYLQKLHPTCFEDLVILNCMYRLGPMEYISTLVKHKNSKKAVKYMIPCSEKYLHNTYGIIIYQEQIMMLSRLIANFNRSESDLLRKALGKRKMDVLSVLKPRFIEGASEMDTKRMSLKRYGMKWRLKVCTLSKSHTLFATHGWLIKWHF